MFPTVVGPIHTYGLMLLIGFYAGWLLSLWRARKEGVEGRHITDLLVYTVISAIFGARLLYVIQYWSHFSSFWDFFKVWEGGLVFYGGMVTGTITVTAVIVRRKLSIRKLADILGPSVALGLVFGRIGCFGFGCCYGDVTHTFPLRVQFPGKFVSAIDTRENKPVLKPEGSPAFLDQVERKLIEPPARAGAAKSLPVYPTQLMESFNALLICLIGSFFFRCRKRYGEVFFLVGILYCAQRFVLEILRDDNPSIFVLQVPAFLCRLYAKIMVVDARPLTLEPTISQALSIVFGIICLVLFVQSRRLPPNVTALAPASGMPAAKMPPAKPRKGTTSAGG